MKEKLRNELREKLKNDIDKASWELLQPHYDRNALFMCEALDLLDVAVAVASDDAENVQLWQKKELLRPLSEAEVDEFKKEPAKDCCTFIIVQPYVFIKRLS